MKVERDDDIRWADGGKAFCFVKYTGKDIVERVLMHSEDADELLRRWNYFETEGEEVWRDGKVRRVMGVK